MGVSPSPTEHVIELLYLVPLHLRSTQQKRSPYMSAVPVERDPLENNAALSATPSWQKLE